MGLATVTRIGRAALAKSLSTRPLFLGWGTGDPEWDSRPGTIPSLVPCTQLAAEVGRRKVGQVSFVEPDPDGEIVLPTGSTPDGAVQESRYRMVNEPTPHLYVRAAYDFGDAANLVIREIALFSEVEVNADLPPGQRYFLPADIVDSGYMVAAEILRPPLNRSASVRQTIEFVFTL